mmetsp:Transcript_48579/g.95872  ORF Transcript_48579/g.95872 Transcript_48579/m.95872 type:complete len:101 (+) Transcript_48579:300-602(+)
MLLLLLLIRVGPPPGESSEADTDTETDAALSPSPDFEEWRLIGGPVSTAVKKTRTGFSILSGVPGAPPFIEFMPGPDEEVDCAAGSLEHSPRGGAVLLLA